MRRTHRLPVRFGRAFATLATVLSIETAHGQSVCDDADAANAIAVGRNAGPNMRVAVYGDQATNFGGLAQLGSGWGDSRGATAVAWGNVDNDPQLELIVGRSAGDNVRLVVYDDQGAGFVGISPVGDAQLGFGWGDDRGVTSIATGDVDGDGLDEIVVGRNAGPNARVIVYDDALSNFVGISPQGSAQLGFGWGDDRGASSVATGDVDGDGLDEIIVGRTPGDNVRVVVYDDATANFVGISPQGSAQLGFGWGDDRGVSSVAAGDVDGDGLDEIIVGRTPGDHVRVVVYDDATANFVGISPQGAAQLGFGWGDSRGASAVAAGDVDGDGLDEVVVGRTPGTGSRIIVYDDALSNFVGISPSGAGQLGLQWGDGRGVTSIAVGDLDSDPELEIVVGRNPGPNGRVFAYDDSLNGFAGISPTGSNELGFGWGDDRGALSVAVQERPATLVAECTVTDPMCPVGTLGGVQCANGVPIGACVPVANPCAALPPTCVGGAPATGDTDGDALLDCWETDGIDADGDGVVDLVLPDADPMRADVYVEIDFMTGQAPIPAGLDSVVAAFANSPVMNPDGSTGVTLHLEVDDDVPFVQTVAFGDPPDPGSVEYNEIKRQFFGTAAERADAANFAQARRARSFAYRYALFAFDQQDTPDAGGIAELSGNDLLMSLGDFAQADAGRRQLREEGTFMHELGHNLGLRHGGSVGNAENCKPNYISVMNYAYETDNRFVSGRPLDYSRGTLGMLNEASLDENVGVPGAPMGTRIAFAPPMGTMAGVQRNQPADMPIDWDLDGAITMTASVDINNFDAVTPGGFRGCNGGGAGQVLQDFNDWAALVFNFAASGSFVDASLVVREQDTRAQILAVDSDGDGVPNVEDNCLNIANPDQRDSNGDGVGDLCPMKPILECVERLGWRQYRAHFGYRNDSGTVIVPTGRHNRFLWKREMDQGQPTRFAPGRQQSAFSTEFRYLAAWKLGSRTAIATRFSRRCDPDTRRGHWWRKWRGFRWRW